MGISNNKVKKFLNPDQNVLFAKFKVPAQDDRSAGLLAKKELDGILDLIRFELENRVISVESDFISIRDTPKALEYGIEPTEKLFERTKNFTEYLINNYFEKNILVVCHHQNVRAITAFLLGKNSDEINTLEKIVNTSVTIFEFDGNKNPVLKLINCTKHLE